MAIFVVQSLHPARCPLSPDAAIGSGDHGSSTGLLIHCWRKRYRVGRAWVKLSPLNSPSIEYSDGKQLVQGLAGACGQTQTPPSCGKYANFTCLRSKPGPMIHRVPVFSLPLMHHLMEHRVLDFAPGMSGDVPAADSDFLEVVIIVVD
jgi:hypothetical protein